MPNDRELAVLFWLGAIGVFMLWRSDTRSALGGVAWVLLQPKLAAAFLLLLATVVALCSGGSYIGLWDPHLATDTVFWFFGAGAVLFVRIDQASEPKFFRKAVTQTLALTEFLAFFVNLFVFGLLVELLLQPLVFFLVAMVAVAASKPEYASVRRLMESLLALVGGIVLVFAAVRIAQTWGEVDLPGASRDGLNRRRIGRGAGRSACRAALWGPIPRFRGRSRPHSAAGSPARAIPDAALPRSGELRLGSQQVREAEQQRETLAVLLKTPVADLRVPEVPLHVEKRMLRLRSH